MLRLMDGGKGLRGDDDCCPKGRLDECPRLRAGRLDCPACGPGKVGTACGRIKWEKGGK